MRRHPSYAVEILGPIEFLGPALDIPHYHHERWDGTGYPCGLAGERIPLAARIFAAVDIWDALSSDRPYRRPGPRPGARAPATCRGPTWNPGSSTPSSACSPPPSRPHRSNRRSVRQPPRTQPGEPMEPLGRLDQGVVAPGFVARIAGGRTIAVQGLRDVGLASQFQRPASSRIAHRVTPASNSTHPIIIIAPRQSTSMSSGHRPVLLIAAQRRNPRNRIQRLPRFHQPSEVSLFAQRSVGPSHPDESTTSIDADVDKRSEIRVQVGFE